MGALPAQVQKQVDEANRILEEINKPPADPTADPAPAPAAPAAPAVSEEPIPVVVADPAPAPAEPIDEGMEHKYKVLQGKYNAEVPKLSRDLRDSQDQVTELRQRVNNTESLIASMQTVQAPAAPAAPAATELPVVTEEDTRQFGPDLIDLISRVAERTLIPQIDSRVQPLGERISAGEQTASKTVKDELKSQRDKLIDALTTAVPGWLQQNEDKVFLRWLNENDPYAGMPRGQLLTNAFNSNNAEVVIAIFKGFQTENAVVAPEGEVTPPVTPEEPQQALEELVAPGTPKTGTTGAPNESGKRVWSRKMISDFYAAKNEVHRKGQKLSDEFVALEKDLFAAQTSGRITA